MQTPYAMHTITNLAASVAPAATYIVSQPAQSYDYPADLSAEMTVEAVAARLNPLALAAGHAGVSIMDIYDTHSGHHYCAHGVGHAPDFMPVRLSGLSQTPSLEALEAFATQTLRTQLLTK